MSKKKSTIMDDDPLAWLRDEPSDDAVDDINIEAQVQDEPLESAPEEIVAKEVSVEDKQESDSHIVEQIAEQIDEKAGSEESESDESDIEQSFIKEKAEGADSNEECLVAATEIETEVDIEKEMESQTCSSEESQVTASEEDKPVAESSLLSENNEEDVAMATSNSEKIILEEDVSIVQVAVLKEAWLPMLDSGKDIDINASAVEDIDTAGLQLLLSLVKTAKDSGRSVTWESPSEAVINAVKETSLRDALGIQI